MSCDPAPTRRPTRGELLALGGVLALGAGLRLWRPTLQSLWLDELFSLYHSRPDRPLVELVAAYARDVHPLLYPLLLRAWLQVFGTSELTLRLASVIPGIVSLAALCWVGRRLASPRVGLIAALLAAVNAFHLAYSQEARSYSLLFLLATLSLAALVELTGRPSRRSVLGYAVIGGLLVHTHYYGVILVGAELAAAALIRLAAERRSRTLLPLVAAGGGVVFLALPWIGPLLRAGGTRDYWPAVPHPWFFVDYFHQTFGREPLLSLLFASLLVALPWLLVGAPGAAGSPGTSAPALAPRTLTRLLTLVIVFALLVPYLWSVTVVPLLIHRCTIVVLPALLLLVALAVDHLRHPNWRRATLALAVAGSLWNLLVTTRYYSTVRNEQWREAIVWSLDHPRSQRAEHLWVSPYDPGFALYADLLGRPVAVAPARPESLQRFLATPHGRGAGIWLLLARDHPGDADFRQLLERRFRRVEQRAFHRAAAELWLPRSGSGRTGRRADDPQPTPRPGSTRSPPQAATGVSP